MLIIVREFALAVIGRNLCTDVDALIEKLSNQHNDCESQEGPAYRRKAHQAVGIL
jgi:hypothetical protein